MGRIRSFLRGCNKKRPAVRSFLYGKMKMEGNSCHPYAGALWVLEISGKFGAYDSNDMKTIQPGWRPWEMHPFCRLRRRLPLKGKRLTTFCASLALLQNVFAVHPRESVSHDSQVAALPYESCSLATPEGEILAALRFAVLMRSLLFCGFILPPGGGGKRTKFVGSH